MELKKLKLTEIKPYGKNPRKNDGAVDAVAESIKQCGYCSPIVVDENYEVLAGHTRLKALKKLGRKECEVVVTEGLTEEQNQKYRILDNKTGEFAEWDLDILQEQLKDLDFEGFDFGFEFPSFEEPLQIVEDEIPEVDDENEPTAKTGDVWQLGRHRLMCGDSTSATDVEKLMNGNKADIVLSDPPYGMNLDTDFSTIKGLMKSIGKKNHTQGNKYNRVIGDNEDFKPELISTFFDNFGYVKEMFLFGADYYAELLQDKNNGSWLVWDKRKPSQADAIGSEFELCWSKTKHKRRMLRHDWFGFLSSENQQDARNRVHPTQKPITLIVDILNQWGNGCSNVIDLYGGSGSTLIACEQLGKTCFMMELDPHYVDVIIARWEKFTGQKAVKLN